MKKIFSYIVTSVISLSFGYVVYPIVNTVKEPELKPNNIEEVATKKHVKKLSQLNNTIINKDSEISNVIDDERLIDQQSFPKSSEELTKSYELSMAEKDLAEWAVLHKEQLQSLIVENVPAIIADSMTSMVLRDNDFLNAPTVKQEADLDVNWAYIMEQDLRHIIEQHPESFGFNLLQLTCKQLRCEIVGVEVEKGAWRKIFFSLLQTAPSINLPDGQHDAKNVIFSESNVLYIYSQLEFTINNED